jgi:small subunit ribosomal protein S8
LVLKYNANGEPKISSLKRISKPGRRVYIDKENIPTVLNGFGLAIISTSKGMMTNMDAKKGRIGGEFICEVY